MKKYIYIIEKCYDTKLLVGCIPGFAGAPNQAETLDETSDNIREVIEMLTQNGESLIGSNVV